MIDFVSSGGDRNRGVGRPVASPPAGAGAGPVDHAGGLAGHGEEVVRVARARHRREHAVAEAIAARPAPVVGQLPRAGGGIGERRLVSGLVLGGGEAVHGSVVDVLHRPEVVVLEVDLLVGQPAQRDRAAVERLAGRGTVALREAAEQVVVGAVLLDDVDDVLDRRRRGRGRQRIALRGWGRRRAGLDRRPRVDRRLAGGNQHQRDEADHDEDQWERRSSPGREGSHGDAYCHS